MTKNKTYHAMLYNAALCEMRDVLENKRHLVQPNLRPQQIVVIILQFRIREVVPPVHQFSMNGERKRPSEHTSSRRRTALPGL
jgi:hypothetical protein